MKKPIALAFLVCVLLTSSPSGCGPAPTPLPTAFPDSTFTPQPTATQTPSPTTALPVWMEINSPDTLFEYSSPDGFYYQKAVSGADVRFDADTRWKIDVQVDALKEDVGESSSGILLRGLTGSGQIATLYLVYQYGFWSLGYGVNRDMSYWQTFEQLTDPVQSFEMFISNDGRQLSIQNGGEFKFSHQMSVILFPARGTLQLGAQIAPHTKVSISNLVIDQLRSPVVGLENADSTATQSSPMGTVTGKVVFDYSRSAYENDFPDLQGDSNVFTADLDGTHPVPITDGLMLYNHVAGVSPDGRKVLVQTAPANYTTYEGTSGIYVVDLDASDSAPIQLASGVFDMGRTTAAWLDNSHIVFIDLVPGGMAVFSINIDGSERTRISQKVPGILSASLLVTADRSRVFWEGYAEEGRRWFYRGIWWTTIDGSEQSKLSSSGVDQDFHLESISPDGSMAVWTRIDDMTGKDCHVYVASTSAMDQASDIKLDCGGDYQLLWSADSSKVFMNSAGYILESSGFVNPNSAYILSPRDLTLREFNYPIDNMLYSVHVMEWTADGQGLLVKVNRLLGDDSTDGTARVAMKLLTLETRTFLDLLTSIISRDAVGQMHWLLESQ